MRKNKIEDVFIKAKRREIKKRPRMKVHGLSLKLKNAHGGKKLVSQK
jgi:hypothetical protein